MSKYVDIVFNGPPTHHSPRFIEVENEAGASIQYGEWLEREDGYWVLRVAQTLPRQIFTVMELEALPVGSVVLAHWADGSMEDYQMMRCREGGASSGGGFGLAADSHWINMASWGATLTVLLEGK